VRPARNYHKRREGDEGEKGKGGGGGKGPTIVLRKSISNYNDIPIPLHGFLSGEKEKVFQASGLGKNAQREKGLRERWKTRKSKHFARRLAHDGRCRKGAG